MTQQTSVLFLKNQTVPKDPYHDAFNTSGFDTTFVPLLDHIHADLSVITGYLTSREFLYETDSLIITSQRAVEALANALEHITDDERSIILGKLAFTVGPATEKVLRTLGFSRLEGGEDAGNGTILSEHIIKTLSPTQKVTFFTGETRRDIIPRTLLSNGYNLKEVVIYRTVEKPEIIERFTTAFTGKKSDNCWVIFFSPQGTQEIVEFLKVLPNINDINIASIGPTTETYLLENGITPKLVARKPEASSLLQGVITANQS